MEATALVFGILGFVFGMAALSKANSAAKRLDDIESDVRRRAENTAEEVEEALARLRHMMAAQARGQVLTPDMIEEGRLWSDAAPEVGVDMVAAGDVHVLDVRTAEETAGGTIPGAQILPVQELEERFREVPKGKRMLVVCAGGARSAAACEFLSRQGYEDLWNLDGGMGSWTGPVERSS